ncbi:MAG: V-type ATP synthase subunit D [Prevotellaceae bacterium]|jgi:V/A-type H+-transporting ATPase subunit D|nr:V-type ATP synthase subunit D [Prevotellaceae bacterium]
MAIKFQYNKTSLNDLNKQLKIRQKTLPSIKSKESALRMEVKRAKDKAEQLIKELEEKIDSYEYMSGLWNEFEPDLIRIEDLDVSVTKIAGVKIPVLKELKFSLKPYNLFSKPYWYADGVQLLKDLSTLSIESELYKEKMRLLDYSRRKTTQKVNLYEKIQIPGYTDAIRKIKRFLEDEENLSKSAQKIVKKRQEEEAAS